MIITITDNHHQLDFVTITIYKTSSIERSIILTKLECSSIGNTLVVLERRSGLDKLRHRYQKQ